MISARPVLQRSEHISARKAIYERLHPEAVSVTVRGGPGRGKTTEMISAVSSFASDTAAKTGLSDPSRVAPEKTDRVSRDTRSVPPKPEWERVSLASRADVSPATAARAYQRDRPSEI